jgi:hypothetical protein
MKDSYNRDAARVLAVHDHVRADQTSKVRWRQIIAVMPKLRVGAEGLECVIDLASIGE